MGKIFTITALLIVLSIDMFLFLGQAAMLNINPEASRFFNLDSNYLSGYGSNYTVDTSNPTSNLPSQEVITAGDESNIFTDTISVIGSWFSGTIGVGYKYLTAILGGPVNYVKILNLPAAFTFIVGAFWYSLTIFLILAFITGRE